MFKHEKSLLKPVKVEGPNQEYASLLQEQLGGPHGELKAAMQYISQSFRIKDPEIKDLFLDIGAEELSHMEMVAETINLLRGHELQGKEDTTGSIQTHVAGGLSPMLENASGVPWTASYVEVTGDLAANLLSNISAEQRAKVVYEYLLRQIQDQHVQETMNFLLSREEAHNALFREALKKVQDTGSMMDYGVTDDSRLYFDLSTPGRFYQNPRPTAPKFQGSKQEEPQPQPQQR